MAAVPHPVGVDPRSRVTRCVQCGRTLVAGAVDDGEQVAARSARVWQHDAEHGVDGDRGIDGVPSVSEDRDTGFGGEMMGRDGDTDAGASVPRAS